MSIIESNGIPQEELIPESHCTSVMKKIPFNYFWKIIDYQSLFTTSTFPANEELMSPIFSDPNSFYKFCLKIIPKYHSNYEYLGVCLKSKNAFDISISATFSIMSSLKQKSNSISTTYKNLAKESFSDILSCIRVSSLLNDASNLMPQGDLTILCEVAVWDAFHNVEESFTSDASPILKDLNTMFDNLKFSDVVFKVGDKNFPVHKIFLSSRSKVFAAMFEHSMEESNSNLVAVKDVSPEIFQELLRFIYTDKVCNLNEIALDLLVAADKYALISLKKMCEKALIPSLSVENACEILEIADLHSVNDLKTHCIRFINKNATQVFKTDRWKNMIKQCPILVSELLYSALAVENKH